MKKKKLTDYRNFWLIWLTCAGDKGGKTLFAIQKAWGIKTNYLYHKEAGLRKPLYIEMVEKDYLEKVNKRLFAKFDWTKEFVISEFKAKQGTWTPDMMLLKSWDDVQYFLEKYQHIFFNIEKIKTLYRNDVNSIRNVGFSIFNDVFTILLLENLIPFCKRYKAELVIRILNTFLSFTSDRDLYGYYRALQPEMKKIELPKIIESEAKLLEKLSPL